ncbi:hypothetical protein Tco_0629339 [Tanacetum coccineum]|uniref:Uncharacterized protein n=1 Tax=Tanacetum coccineum TaxID=301880 RepID=A0ABQ4WSX4_9ASTR
MLLVSRSIQPTTSLSFTRHHNHPPTVVVISTTPPPPPLSPPSRHQLHVTTTVQPATEASVLPRRCGVLQLGVKSYQKKLNLTRPDTYKSDLKRLPTYSAYPNPRGFIYQNKDKKNKLMLIDELHKFSDGTLNDVRTALDDILKRIRIKYLL